MAQNPQQQEAMKRWGQVMARAWSDEAYKQRLLGEPAAVLAEAGLRMRPTLTVQVHEATPTQIHLILPPPPAGREGDQLSDADLDRVAGGGWETDKWMWTATNPIVCFGFWVAGEF